VISVLAKGAKREKSPFGGPLDLFYRGPALVVFRRSGLHVLSAFAVEDAGTGLRSGLDRTYAASHIAEVLIGMAHEEEPHPGLFARVVDGLAVLGRSGPEEIAPALAALELGVLSDLGFAPSLDRCAVCGRAPSARGRALSPALGGVLCSECRPRDPKAHALPAAVAAALANLTRTSPAHAARIRRPSPALRAIRAFLTAFVEYRLERPLRTAPFL
jgi:DNA repair protein RecO (recombination protein O)